MNTGEEIPKDLPEVKRHTLVLLALAAAVTFAVLFVLGFVIRHHRITEREKMAKELKEEAPVVLVVAPKKTQKSTELALPADVHAFATTALYSRTNGFLASWTADINDRVRKGQVLGVISAPDTDADLEQAQANLKQQETGYQLAQTTEDRYKGLVATQGVTQQQLDQVHSASEQAKANVGSNAASVDRLKALVGFERIVAPYDGVVTARNYDVGALIQSSNIAAGQELFDVAEDDKLRVFVSLPQNYALMIKYGQGVKLSLERNFPGHLFEGKVARSAGMLDPVTRTLRTELDFPNTDPAFHILPGMFGTAHFALERPAPVLTVPTSALLFESNGKFVAIVKPDDTIHFQPITPGSDFGTDIEVLSGLTGTERVVANPGEQLIEGIKVSPQTNATPAKDPKDGTGAKDGKEASAPKDKE